MATTLNATVLTVLPNARFRVETEGHDQVLVHLSGDMRMQAIRFLPGDAVTIEVSPFDRTLGRIVRKTDPEKPGDAASNQFIP